MPYVRRANSNYFVLRRGNSRTFLEYSRKVLSLVRRERVLEKLLVIQLAQVSTTSVRILIKNDVIDMTS